MRGGGWGYGGPWGGGWGYGGYGPYGGGAWGGGYYGGAMPPPDYYYQGGGGGGMPQPPVVEPKMNKIIVQLVSARGLKDTALFGGQDVSKASFGTQNSQ